MEEDEVVVRRREKKESKEKKSKPEEKSKNSESKSPKEEKPKEKKSKKSEKTPEIDFLQRFASATQDDETWRTEGQNFIWIPGKFKFFNHR